MAAQDLCALNDVRAQLQKKSSDTSQDTFISALITDASQMLIDEYEQEWAPTTASATRLFELPRPNELMSLAPYALRTISTIVVDSDQGAGVTLSADEYRAWPIPAKDGVILALHLRPLSFALGAINYKDRQVSITGAWGYPSVPLPVKRACAMTVRHWIVTSTATFRHQDDSMSDAVPVQRGIPPEARELLRRYRRGGAMIG